jgi:hypothetical protein
MNCCILIIFIQDRKSESWWCCGGQEWSPADCSQLNHYLCIGIALSWLVFAYFCLLHTMFAAFCYIVYCRVISMIYSALQAWVLCTRQSLECLWASVQSGTRKSAFVGYCPKGTKLSALHAVQYIGDYWCGLLTSVIVVARSGEERCCWKGAWLPSSSSNCEFTHSSHRSCMQVLAPTTQRSERQHHMSMKRFTFNLVIHASQCDDSPPLCRQ